MNEWTGLARWWIDEGARDPVYDEDVFPLLEDFLEEIHGPILDMGCGEGQIMRRLAPRFVVGCDMAPPLLVEAAAVGPVVRAKLPDLSWLRPRRFAGAVAVFVIDHIADLAGLFEQTATVIEEDGVLAVITNHPAYTAEGAGPVVDQSDGEVLWRWGRYFESHTAYEPAGCSVVAFHHRSLGQILCAASDAGWSLDRFEERAVGPQAVTRCSAMTGQDHMPRLLGMRWRKRLSWFKNPRPDADKTS